MFLPAQWDRLYSEQCGHLPVPIRSLDSPRLLWVNSRALCADPSLAQLVNGPGLDVERAFCRFAVIADVDSQSQIARSGPFGIADRYGGEGIGNNGGSGRNIFFNGLCVKGIGRTGLVGARTSPTHARGGAYLEESVRDVIFSELVDHDFPFGSVPILAVIDTGINQVWDCQGGKSERRVLVIRPPILRLAHFERAWAFNSNDQREGIKDEFRVEQMFAVCKQLYGNSSLPAVIDECMNRWTHQLAYGFIHRLPHGGNTTSNISIDGRLLDFGGMTAVPDWSRANFGIFPRGLSNSFEAVARAIKSLSYYLGRYCGREFGSGEYLHFCLDQNHRRFKRLVAYEMLRLAGVADSVARNASERTSIQAVVLALVLRSEQRVVDLILKCDGYEEFSDVFDVWGSKPDSGLRDFRRVAFDLVPPHDRARARGAAYVRARSRHWLTGRRLKDELYALVDGGRTPDPTVIAEVISKSLSVGAREQAHRGLSSVL